MISRFASVAQASFTTWLYRLVTNQGEMHFRYRSSRPEMQPRDGETPEPWLAVARRNDPREQFIDRLAIEAVTQSESQPEDHTLKAIIRASGFLTVVS